MVAAAVVLIVVLSKALNADRIVDLFALLVQVAVLIAVLIFWRNYDPKTRQQRYVAIGLTGAGVLIAVVEALSFLARIFGP